MNKILTITAILMTAIFASSVLAISGNTAIATVHCTQDSDCTPQILNLCTKDSTTPTWQCDGRATGTLTFDQSGNPWWLTTNGLNNLQTSKQWALIYYPDQADRFNKWNGAGGIVLAIWGPGDANGPVNPPAVDLPIVADWNIAPDPNYCNKANVFDSYAHCSGAKIWIVLTNDLSGGSALPLINWNPTKWLFETDLITYSTHKISICNSGQCELTPKTCGVSATGIDFGSIVPGTTVGGDGSITSTVTNGGNSPTTELDISGTDWTPYMPVGQTDWSVGTGWKGPLTTSNVNTGTNVAPGSPLTTYFKLTVPSGQATGAYTQTITFTGSC